MLTFCYAQFYKHISSTGKQYLAVKLENDGNYGNMPLELKSLSKE